MIKLGRFTVGSWSTFGQTALLIFAALFVAQAFAIILMRTVIDEWQNSYVEQPTIGRFADVARQIQSAPAKQRDQILFATSQMGEHFWLARDVRFAPFGRQSSLEQDLAAALKKRSVPFSAVLASRGGGFRGWYTTFGEEHRPGPVVLSNRANMEGGEMISPPEPPREGLQAGAGGAPSDAGPVILSRGPAPPADAGPPPAAAGAQNTMVARGVGSGPQTADSAPHDAMFIHGFHAGPDGPPPGQMHDEIQLAALLTNGEWLVGRFLVHRPVPLLLNPIVISQIALFMMLLGASLFWASRISRPLRILARAAEVLRPQEQFVPIPAKGPRDVQAAINSFNAMAKRVHDLLEEKDHMLSAIGHDLRTPLASLRIRAETVEPEAERERFIESIEEMTKMVEEILGLARLGHSKEPRQLVDLAALADAVVEEFRGLGKDVTFVEAPRTPVEMQVGPVRRLLRNLIDNAVKYGEKAHVSVLDTGSTVEVCVEDEGPGIPPERLSEVLQPFTRLEHSRSRSTGGIGLGLSIADAIARSQGAALTLQNRASGGLRAIVRWPRSSASSPQERGGV